MSAAGVGVCGISVGLFKHAALGVDPFQSLMSGLDAVIPIRFGALYVLVNLVLLVVSLLADRKKIGLATIINLLFLGYIAEYSQKFFERIFPSPDIIGRFLLLVIYHYVPGFVILFYSKSWRFHVRCCNINLVRAPEQNPFFRLQDHWRCDVCCSWSRPLLCCRIFRLSDL